MGFVNPQRNRIFVLIIAVLMFWVIQQMPSTQLIAEEIESSSTDNLKGIEEIQTDLSGKFKFVPALSVYEVYDDNIFFLEEERIDDFITIISPSAVLTYETPKARVSASYMSGYELFYEYPELNTTENQNASVNLSLRPTKRIGVDVTDSMAFYSGTLSRGYGSRGGGIGYFGYYGIYRREQDLMLSPEERRRNYIEMLAYPSDYWSNSVDATVSYKVSESIDTRVGYFNRFFKYRERGPYRYALEDTTEQGARAGLDYRYSIRDTFNLQYSYYRFSYTQERDTDVHSISSGWTHRFSPTLSFSLSGGIMFISGVYQGDANEESEIGWQGSANLTKSFRKGSATLGYTRSVSAYGGMGGTGVYQTCFLNIDGRFTPRLDIGLTGSYSTYRPTVEGRGYYYQELEYYTMGFNLGYTFTRRLRGISSYFYTHQSLEQTGEDLHYHQATLGLEYSITRWLSSNLLYTYSNYSFPLENIGDINIYNNRIMLGLSFTWQQ